MAARADEDLEESFFFFFVLTFFFLLSKLCVLPWLRCLQEAAILKTCLANLESLAVAK